MLKYAVYISGHYRNLNETWEQYKEIFKNTDLSTFDFYFCLWNVKDTNDNTLITQESIYSICPDAKGVKIIESTYIPPDLSNKFPKPIYFQAYMIKSAFDLIPQNYDFYIRIRPDLYFFDKNIFREIEHIDGDLILPSKVWYCNPNYPLTQHLFNDYLWIGKYNISKYIALFYDNVDKYEVACNETTLTNYLRDYNETLNVCHFTCDFNLDRRTRGAEMWLQESRDMTVRRQQIESNK